MRSMKSENSLYDLPDSASAQTVRPEVISEVQPEPRSNYYSEVRPEVHSEIRRRPDHEVRHSEPVELGDVQGWGASHVQAVTCANYANCFVPQKPTICIVFRKLENSRTAHRQFDGANNRLSRARGRRFVRR